MESKNRHAFTHVEFHHIRGLLVLSSNSASLYDVLKKLGIEVPNEGYGKVSKLM